MTEVAADFGDDVRAGRFDVRRLLARLTPAAFLEAFGAEPEHWFLWVPVFLGAGIAAYLQLGSEPPVLLAMAPLMIAVVLSWQWRQGSLAVIVSGAVLAATLRFALGKLGTDFVTSPVLERQYGFADVRGFVELVELVEPRLTRGQRITVPGRSPWG
jgi:competence protein ComEC